MHSSPDPFAALLAEGRRLIEKRPRCHKSLNDHTAAVIIAKMHADHGIDAGLRIAEECIARIRIAVETGIYPEEMLRQAGETLAGRAGGLS